MPRSLVFLVNTDAEGRGEVDAKCVKRGCLNGPVRNVQYITDGRVPYEPTACLEITGAESGVEILRVENVTGRATWNLDNRPALKNEPVKVVVTNAGKGKSGSFVVITE